MSFDKNRDSVVIQAERWDERQISVVTFVAAFCCVSSFFAVKKIINYYFFYLFYTEPFEIWSENPQFFDNHFRIASCLDVERSAFWIEGEFCKEFETSAEVLQSYSRCEKFEVRRVGKRLVCVYAQDIFMCFGVVKHKRNIFFRYRSKIENRSFCIGKRVKKS